MIRTRKAAWPGLNVIGGSDGTGWPAIQTALQPGEPGTNIIAPVRSLEN
jgi:hypothetical protein